MKMVSIYLPRNCRIWLNWQDTYIQSLDIFNTLYSILKLCIGKLFNILQESEYS